VEVTPFIFFFSFLFFLFFFYSFHFTNFNLKWKWNICCDLFTKYMKNFKNLKILKHHFFFLNSKILKYNRNQGTSKVWALEIYYYGYTCTNYNFLRRNVDRNFQCPFVWFHSSQFKNTNTPTTNQVQIKNVTKKKLHCKTIHQCTRRCIIEKHTHTHYKKTK